MGRLNKRRRCRPIAVMTIASVLLVMSQPASAQDFQPDFSLPKPPAPTGSTPAYPGGDIHPGQQLSMELWEAWSSPIPTFLISPGRGNEEFVRLWDRWYEQNDAFVNDHIAQLRSWAYKPGPLLRPGEATLSDDEREFVTEVEDLIERVKAHRNAVRDAAERYHRFIEQEVDSKRFCEAYASDFLYCPSQWEVAEKLPMPAELRSLFTVRFASPDKPEPATDEPLTASIVAVTVEDKAYETAREKADAALRNARAEYDIAFQGEQATRTRFKKALDEHTRKVRAAESARVEAERRLTRLRRGDGVPGSPVEEVRRSESYRNLEAAIARQQAIVDRLKGRVEQVKSWGGSEASVQASLRTLQTSIDEAVRTIEHHEREQARLIERALQDPPATVETEEMAELRRQIETSRRDKIWADNALQDVSETLLEDSEALDRKERLLAKAMQDVDALKGKEAKPLLNIRTNYTFDARFTNRRAEMKDLNRAIKLSRQAVFEAERQREMFRYEMLEANEETSIASENLEQAIMDSARSQLALEALMQAKEGIDAAKAGPATFLLWSTNRALQNVFNPPKVYEPEYRLDGAQSVLAQIIEGFAVKDGQEAAARAAKYGRDKSIDHLLSTTKDTLKLGVIEQEMQKIVSQRAGTSNTGTLATLLTRYKQQEALYDSASRSLSEKMFQKGKGKFAASVTKDMLSAQLKSITVEAVKRKMADFFEGDAWRTYMGANQRFVLAVRTFRAAGNIYWENRDTLDGLVALRDAILGKYYDEKSKLIIEKSEAFNVTDEVRIWVTFANQDGEPETSPHPGNVRLLLNRTPLTRLRGTNIFDLSEEGAKALRKQRNPNLTITIAFE